MHAGTGTGTFTFSTYLVHRGTAAAVANPTGGHGAPPSQEIGLDNYQQTEGNQ